MNKIYKVVASAALALTLAGCSDASAKVSDSKSVLFSVGKTGITKGEAYSVMMTMAGADTAINNATNTIAKAEIEVTDDIKAQADSTLNTYKSMYGETFNSYLSTSGSDENTYLNDYLIPSLLASKLTDKYIEDNWDELVSKYKPMKATVIGFTSMDDLNAAKGEIDGGTDVNTAASSHNASSTNVNKIYTTESTDLDETIRTALSAMRTSDGWQTATGSDGSTQYLFKVDADDPTTFKDEVITALADISSISTDSTTYFFKKHGFHVYDITLYNGVKAAYSSYLVQGEK